MAALRDSILSSGEEIEESFLELPEEDLTINDSTRSPDLVLSRSTTEAGISVSDVPDNFSDIRCNEDRNAEDNIDNEGCSSVWNITISDKQEHNSNSAKKCVSSSNISINNGCLQEPIDHSIVGARYTSVFKNAINDEMSSTLCLRKQYDSEYSDKSSNDSIVITSRNDSIVYVSSDDGESNDDKKLPYKSTEQKKKQPKITSLQESNKNTVKIVSQAFYDKEFKKLNELRSDLCNAENLLEKLGPNLYDGGKQLALRVESLKSNVKKKTDEMNMLVVENIQYALDKPKSSHFKDTSSWDELSAAVNDIKPVYTGKQGLNTFNKQKVLTIERLQDLHGSLETCPGENVFADDPKELKVSLMPHQKHALAWMAWREQQKPRGGILADDMGLGKTLTMISMVLATKNITAGTKESTDSDDGDNHPPTKNYKGGTLVVCPASLLRQWEQEIESKVYRHKLSVCVHHGNNRDSKPRHLSSYDVVITTYNIVSRELKSRGALFCINWQRIILDEAHIIRNHKSQSSEGVCELKGKFRWALTGTPIQNKEMDVYALLKFLKCTPFDDLNHWKKWIDNKSAGGQQRLNTLMKSLMLRRTKVLLQEQGSLICLPERFSELIEVNLEKEEMNVYQKIMTYSKTLFAQFLLQRTEKTYNIYSRDQGLIPTSKQTKDSNVIYHKIHQKFSKIHNNRNEVKTHQILVLLLRLRQICCHPGLIDAMLEDNDNGLYDSSSDDDEEIDLLDQLNKLAIGDDDETQSFTSEQNCHETAISKASAKVLQKSNPVFNLSRPSSKMTKVLQIVKSRVLNSADKGIIISQWTSILNILRDHLEAIGIRTLSLNGSIPVKNRQDIVTEFNDPNTKPKILLLSLTAGGVGLNLTGANHLFLIDLHWNPQLEMQAQDRIYRVGQKKTVYIYKFICKDTVEERIKALQDQKLKIAEGLLTGAKASDGNKLSIEDLKGLFGL